MSVWLRVTLAPPPNTLLVQLGQLVAVAPLPFYFVFAAMAFMRVVQ